MKFSEMVILQYYTVQYYNMVYYTVLYNTYLYLFCKIQYSTAHTYNATSLTFRERTAPSYAVDNLWQEER